MKGVLLALTVSLWGVCSTGMGGSETRYGSVPPPAQCRARLTLQGQRALLALRGGSAPDAGADAGDGDRPPAVSGGGDRDRQMRDSDYSASRPTGAGGGGPEGGGGDSRGEGRSPAGAPPPREGVGKPCLDWRQYRPNTDAERRRESKLAGNVPCPLLSLHASVPCRRTGTSAREIVRVMRHSSPRSVKEHARPAPTRKGKLHARL
jgi:hypothetical protein